jgi:hypothetical protein
VKRSLVVLALALALVAAPRVVLRAQDEKPAVADKPELVAIGGLGASMGYFTFVLVGVTGDSFEKGSHDAATVKSVVDELAGTLDKNVEQLMAVKKSGKLVQADVDSIEEVADCLRSVKDYAKKLCAYTEEKSQKNADGFQASRKVTWEKLKKLLGIKD